MTTLTLPPQLLRRSHPDERPTAPVVGRRLASYLLVPRPKDLVKAIVLPLVFLVAAATQGDLDAGRLGRGLLVWVALELLVYQARYQWNDIRGFEADQAHPDSASRGRLPGPVEKGRSRKGASLAVVLARLGLTAALALAFPSLRVLLVAMTVGVFGVAWVYERLRSAATGRTSTVPVPLRPSLVGLWVAVGAGYAVRGLTGLALAVDLRHRPGLVAAVAVSAWSLGIVFVTCRWLLEAMCFGELDGPSVAWRIRKDQAREHTLGLVRWLPADATAASGPGLCGWRALQGRTSLTAPWHLALAVAAASAAASGALLVGGTTVSSVLALALVGGLTAVAVAASPGRRRIVAVLGGLVLVGAASLYGAAHPWSSALPWTTVVVLYGFFTRQCADEVGRPLRRLEPLLSR